jgi:hypothetical protein
MFVSWGFCVAPRGGGKSAAACGVIAPYFFDDDGKA